MKKIWLFLRFFLYQFFGGNLRKTQWKIEIFEISKFWNFQNFRFSKFPKMFSSKNVVFFKKRFPRFFVAKMFCLRKLFFENYFSSISIRNFPRIPKIILRKPSDQFKYTKNTNYKFSILIYWIFDDLSILLRGATLN